MMRQGPYVLVFPEWRDNPFLNLLALAPRSQGYRFIGSTSYDGLLLQMRRLGAGDVFHLHWTQPLLQTAGSADEARRRLSVLTDEFQALAQRGVAFIWTVHNRLPHELSYPDEERRLYRLVATAADAIHIMAPGTPNVIADVVSLEPSKLRVIPHPSYEGIYDTSIDRDAARASFDLRHSDRAALFLGQIRPYKGVDSLVAAAASAAPRARDIVLMLAGVVKEIALEDFESSLPPDLRTIAQLSFIEDGDVGRWFRAADIAVFPYRAILNSGSLHLAASFRTPVVIPDEPHLRSQFGTEPWVRFFDPANPAESLAAILSEDDLFADLTADSFRDFTDPISPWTVSRQYAGLLDSLTSASTGGL